MENQITSNINTHMIHAEDMIFRGAKEMKWLVKMMASLYGNMCGYGNYPITLSVKIDGAPALFAWSKFPGIPDDGIAMKSLFSKNPKILTNHDEIDMHTGGRPELNYKLKSFFKYLKSIEIPEGEIWQGDFLFDDKSKVERSVYERTSIIFQPNTIAYSLPIEQAIKSGIKNSQVGICWHTVYKGDSLEKASANYDANILRLKHTSGIYMTDPYINNFKFIKEISVKNAKWIEESLAEILEYSDLFGNDKRYQELIRDKGIFTNLSIFQNQLIRNGKKVLPKQFIDEFKAFIMIRAAKSADKLKTEKSKDKVLKIAQSHLDFIEADRILFYALLNVIKKITEVKDFFINRLNDHGEFYTYVNHKTKGLIQCNHEGFALGENGNVIKLINRYEFSHHNFSSDFIKGWQ